MRPQFKPTIGNRFDEALDLASRLHRDQTRKGVDVPYLSHLMSVASLVLEANAYCGFGDIEDLAIAALLHDAVEDQGHQITLQAIRDRFGERVHDIVAACTDAVIQEEGEEKPPWGERKAAYVGSIGQKTREAQLVACADKLHNARSIMFDHERIGSQIWERFNPAREETLWYYESLVSAFERGWPGNPLLPELRDVVGRMRVAVEAD